MPLLSLPLMKDMADRQKKALWKLDVYKRQVIHPQWLVPMESGANIGNCYVVTEDGYENLTCHTPIETVRIKA